jgi:short-subunit dehydrogenase
MDANVLSHFWTVREFLPGMIQKYHGHIITVASATSLITIGQIADYTCSKAATVVFHEGLTQELKHWYKSKKIRTR